MTALILPYVLPGVQGFNRIEATRLTHRDSVVCIPCAVGCHSLEALTTGALIDANGDMVVFWTMGRCATARQWQITHFLDALAHAPEPEWI
jgi:hypothetical protein